MCICIFLWWQEIFSSGFLNKSLLIWWIIWCRIHPFFAQNVRCLDITKIMHQVLPLEHKPKAETTLGSATFGPYQTAVNDSLFWKPSQILNCWTQCKCFHLKLLKALHEVLPAYTVSSPVALKSNVWLQWYPSLLPIPAIVFPMSPTWITIMYIPMKILLIIQGLAQIEISLGLISSYPPVSSINSYGNVSIFTYFDQNF